MQITVNGRFSNDYLVLGFGTDIGRINAEVCFKANSWAPKNAKSYNIKIQHETKDGLGLADSPTGYGRAFVTYFTTKKEGQFIVLDKAQNHENWVKSFD